MKRLFILLFILISLKCFSQNHWVPDYHQFPTNMNVVAILEINGIEQQTEMLELGVFCDDECRGSCRLHYYASPVDRYLFFLTTYGESGDPYTFKLFDHLTQQELDFTSPNEMAFHSNDIIGQVFDPYIFSFTGGNCSVTLISDPVDAGVLGGGGDYLCGTYCTVTAQTVDDHAFIAWMLGSDTLTTEESFSFNAVADIELRACFSEPVIPETYEIQVVLDPVESGSVVGQGTFMAGAVCTLSVVPNEHYKFENWTENGSVVSTEQNYSFIVVGDRSLVAHLTDISAVQEQQETIIVYPNPTKGKVWVARTECVGTADFEVEVYDVFGNRLFTSTESMIDLSGFREGAYYLRTNEGKVGKVLLIH